MEKVKNFLSGIFRYGFIRSVITRVAAIFMVISIIVTAAALMLFTSEMRKTILDDRQKQLIAVGKTISDRMREINDIAYSIEHDSQFVLEPVEDDPKAGIEMSKTLKRYLGGNNFIEHLAFCRTAEPDKIYISNGERSLSEFFGTTFGMGAEGAAALIAGIHAQTSSRISVFGNGEGAYFAYLYPLPQLVTKPKAHVLVLIKASKVAPLLDPLLTEGRGEVAVYDAEYNPIYHIGENSGISLTDFVSGAESEKSVKSPSGESFILQKVVSEGNSWTYVSVTHRSDTLSGLANRLLAFIVLVLLILLVAIIIMMISVIYQYKPIAKLAAEAAGEGEPDGRSKPIDERALLSDTLATLRGDSEQKQKYQTAYYEAEAASKAKSAFLSSMSHDIRTPMNAVIGMTALALKHKDDPAYVEDCLKKVQSSSEYLLDIINNVLDMSRIESGRIPITSEPVSIPVIIDSVISLMTSGAEAKGQTIETDISGIRQTAVLGDSVHIIQVFVNIVSNAVKFTPEGGRITVKAIQTDCDGEGFGDYVFTFTDTGVGIPPEFIDRVFETFSRADDATGSKTEGTGLGMAIAKKLTELMNGKISCESVPGKGTTFTVKLRMKLANEAEAEIAEPVNGRTHGADGDSSKTSVDLSGRHILLAEDNLINRQIAHSIISETGAGTDEAKNGKEAVDAFMKSPEGYYDIILMDIQMPVMNGYEATEAIRSSGRSDARTVIIYAVTANTFDEDVRNVKAAGMNGHIGKPYDPEKLYKILSRELKRQTD